MRNRKVIAKAKRNQNLFTLELVYPRRAIAMTMQPKIITTAGRAQAIAIIGQRQSTHLVSQNKRICLGHRRLTYVSNTCIVKAAKLIDGINLEQEDKEYNLVEVFVDSDNFDKSVFSDEEGSSTQLSTKGLIIVLYQIVKNPDAIDKLYTTCMGNKLTRMVRYSKSMIIIIIKLKNVYSG